MMETIAIVGAVAAGIQAVVVVVAAIYALGQVKEARKGRSVEIVLHLFTRLHNEEASERRRRLYQEIYPAYPNITGEQARVIQDVISDFYLVGYLVETRLLDFSLIAGLYYGSAVRCWRITEPYILRERALRGTAYAHYFEALYRRCLEYLATSRPTDDPQIYIKSLVGDSDQVSTEGSASLGEEPVPSPRIGVDDEIGESYPEVNG